MFSPETHFFEQHGHTLVKENELIDFLETELYKTA